VQGAEGHLNPLEENPELIHIFTAGDHYSPKTGSSVPTVIYEISRNHDLRSGRSRVLVGCDTFKGFPPYPIGQPFEVDFGKFPPRAVRMIDALLGAAHLTRRFKWKVYSAACDAIAPDFAGWIIVHGEPAIIRPLKKARPDAKIALYCHYDLFRWYTRPEVRAILGDLDCIVCISQYIARYVAAKAGGWSAKLGVVMNGVDTVRFSPPTTPPGGEALILFAGRVHPDKGVHLLMRAALELKRRGHRFRLKIAGGQLLARGVPLSDYETQLRTLGDQLGDAVQFVPFVDRENIPELYREANIFCAPSVWNEPFGLVVAEALSSGLPVVASRRGTIPEVGGDAVLYFEVPDTLQLADQLERLLVDEELRLKLGRAARARALQLTWSAAYDGLMSLFNSSRNGRFEAHSGPIRSSVRSSDVGDFPSRALEEREHAVGANSQIKVRS
jgi:glycosyltransferase involved in cell wall biosynthesis